MKNCDFVSECEGWLSINGQHKLQREKIGIKPCDFIKDGRVNARINQRVKDALKKKRDKNGRPMSEQKIIDEWVEKNISIDDLD